MRRSMATPWPSVKVGVFVVIAIMVSVFAYRVVDERGRQGSGGFTVWSDFRDVQGLVTKSRVVIAGIHIGVIEDIRLVESRARVVIRIRDGVAIHRDALIEKKSASILGEAILVISPGTVSEP